MCDVTFDQSRGVDLDSGKPFHAELFETKLKVNRDRIATPKSNQCFLNFIATPQLIGEGETEGWKMFSDAPQNFRKVIVQNDRGRGYPQLMSGAAANCLANMIYLVE